MKLNWSDLESESRPGNRSRVNIGEKKSTCQKWGPPVPSINIY
jgi:hypothetical protein